MKKISSLIFTNYKVLISRISKSNYLSFSKTVNTNNPFFFYLEQFLTKSYPITRNINETRIFIPPKTLSNPFFSASSTSSRSFRLGQSLLDATNFTQATLCTEIEREREWIEFIHGRGRVILCVARGLCVEKILTAFFHALRGPKKGEKDEAISTRRKSPSVSLQGRPGL